jgi:hypothetical protein
MKPTEVMIGPSRHARRHHGHDRHGHLPSAVPAAPAQILFASLALARHYREPPSPHPLPLLHEGAFLAGRRAACASDERFIAKSGNETMRPQLA